MGNSLQEKEKPQQSKEEKIKLVKNKSKKLEVIAFKKLQEKFAGV